MVATTTTNNATPPSITPARRSLREKLLRRIGLVIVVLTIGFTGFSLIGLFSTTLNITTNTHESSVALSSEALSQQIERYVADVIGVSTDIAFEDYLIGLERSLVIATGVGRELIRQNIDTYLSIRYITREGDVQVAINNQAGTPLPIAYANGRPAPDIFASDAFQALVTEETSQVTFGEFELLRDSDGVPITPTRLILRLYAPVYLATRDFLPGVIELRVDATTLLNEVNNADLSIFDSIPDRRLVLIDNLGHIVADSAQPNNNYLLNIETTAGNVDELSVYRDLIAFGQNTTENSILNLVNTNLISNNFIDIAGVNDVQWQLYFVDDLFSVLRPSLLGGTAIVILSVIIALIAFALLRRSLSILMAPVEAADMLARRIAEDGTAVPTTSATIGTAGQVQDDDLVGTVQHINSKLNTLSDQLKQQITLRNRDVQVAGRIGREMATQADLESLVNRAINLICNELGFYHAQVFLVDDLQQYAILSFSRGETGRALLENAHRLKVGSKTIIGQATSRREPVYVNDVENNDGDVVHGFNPLLPDTRAEMGLPMIIGDDVIGVLDLQSKQSGAFIAEDIPTYQLLADQLAIAIYNARLKEQTAQRMTQVDQLNRQLTRQAWRETDSTSIASQYGDVSKPTEQNGYIAPISIRNEIIGNLVASDDEGALNDGDQMILQAVAERVSLAIENARLFQETQSTLAETSMLYQLSRQLNEADNLNDITQAIVNAVAPDASGAQVWLFDDSVADEHVARMVTDLHLQERAREDGVILIGRELRHKDHPFLAQMSGTNVIYSSDLSQETLLDDELNQLATVMHAMALVIIPIVMRGIWKGYITLEFTQVRRFSNREQRIYEALITQAGVAIDNRLLLQQTEEALTRIAKLYSASGIVNTAQNLSDLVYAAVTTADNPQLEFWLSMPEGEVIEDDDNEYDWLNQARIVARSEGDAVVDADDLYRMDIKPDSPLNLREPEVIHVPKDRHNLAPMPAMMADAGYQFMAIFPMFNENVPIAFLTMVSKDEYELSTDDYEIYTALTGQMSTQIQNRRLLQRTEEALNETRRLYVANRLITDATDIESIYDAIVGQLAMHFLMRGGQANTISLTILQPSPTPTADAPELKVVYQWLSEMERDPRYPVGTVLDHQQYPIVEWVQESDEGWLRIPDVRQDLGMYAAAKDIFVQGETTHSIVAACFQARENVYGVLILRSSNPDLFDNSYMRFLTSVSDQVAIVIERQQLLSEAENERANLNSILSTLPTGVLVLDYETNIPIRFNDRIVELMGGAIDMTRPFNHSDYSIYRTGTNALYPSEDLPINRARETLSQQVADDLVIIQDDYTVDLLINVAPVLDSQNRPTALIAAFEDISALRSMENTLQDNLREQVTLYETQRSLIEANNIDEQLDSLIGQLMMQDASDALIVISDVITDNIYIARNQNEQISDIDDVQALLQPKTKYIKNANRTDDTTRQALEKLGMNSAMIMPLKARSRKNPLGWLLLLDEEKEAFTDEQERILSSIADMATTSLDNNYLFLVTEQSLSETEQLYQATTAISRTGTLDELGEATQNALAYLQPDFVAIGLSPSDDSDELLYVLRENWDEVESNDGFNLDDLLAMPLPDPAGVYLSTINQDATDDFERYIASANGMRSFAVTSLRIKDQPTGRIFLGFAKPRSFTDADKRFLNTVADSTSIMIDYQLLLTQLRSTLQETSTLYQASRALIEVSTPEEVIDVIVDQLIEPHVNQVFFASLRTPRWDSAGVTVDIKASWQSDSDIDLMGVTLSPEQFPAWEQLSSPTILVINDIYAEESGLDLLQQTSIESLDARSLVIIPLRVPNREIGAIWIGSREPYEYTDAMIRIFQRFGEQTSLSLETNYLLEQTKRRARQLETSAQINQRVGTILDLDELLPQVVDLIKEQFGYDHVQIFLMDERDDYAELKASTGAAGEQLLSIQHKLRKGSDSVIGRVTSDAAPAIALDTADANVIHQPNPYLPLTRSEMALPLIIKGKVVGALDVQSNYANAFIEEDITALNILASQIAIGVDNARLYADSESRAYEMSFLFDIVATAAAADSLDEALALIAQRITEDLNALAVAIYLPITYGNAKGTTFQRMAVSAVSGDTPLREDIPEIKVGNAENLIGLVSSTMQAQIINQIEKEIRYYPLSTGANSAIITPISSANTVIGLIAMESQRVNAYNNETLTLMLTLAGSLSAVIQNALLLKQVQETNEQLREIDRLKTQFLANMSHELRTPLNSIIGFSRVMLKGIDGPLTKMQEQDLSTIFTSGNHLLHLINDILDQAKIEANQLSLKQSYFDIKGVVEGAKSMALGLMKDKPNLAFDVEVAPNLPQAYGDEFRSRQILINLVSNAIKFTADGGVRLMVYATHNEDGDIVLQLDVTDTGIGIREEDLSTVFEQFQQVDSSLTRVAGGTGLGLPISKSLAELQGGTLTVKSELNVGSTFSITIPTEPSEADRKALNTDDTDDSNDTKLTVDGGDTAIMNRNDVQKAMQATQNLKALPTKREVLLIEDNKDMVDQFRRVLQREGIEVQTADHPSFAQAMASNLRPNVIIMDVNFADSEGWKILENLKERDDTFDIPVIVNTLSSDSEQAYRLGAHTFMQRPFAPEDLITAVLSAEKESNRERILIIDDQPESIRLLMQLLSEHGDYRVFSAENGEDGISLVARRHPDLIILDLRMPNMDGFAVLDELRSNPETAKIPVMVVTGEIDFSDDEQSQLENIHILHKANIDDASYEAFIEDVRKHLKE